MAKKKATKGALVYLVLDKSGSMSAIQGATIEGVNRFVAETAKADETALYYQMQFDDRTHKVHSGVIISDIAQLDSRTYSPGGNTALLDAVGRAVKEIDDLETKPSKVVIVIMTDGQENSSREYTRAAVQALISKRESEDKWQFLFLGANLDAFAEAGAIGMRNAASSSATWQQSKVGTQAAYMAMSSSTSDYLRGATPTVMLTQDSYNQTLASLQDQDSKSPDNTSTVDTSTSTGTSTGTVDVTPKKARVRSSK